MCKSASVVLTAQVSSGPERNKVSVGESRLPSTHRGDSLMAAKDKSRQVIVRGDSEWLDNDHTFMFILEHGETMCNS